MIIRQLLIYSLLWVMVHSGYGQDVIVQDLDGTEFQLSLVHIPAGRFQMGSPEGEVGRAPDEGPAHNVEIPGFYLSAHEITWGLYNLFVNRVLDTVPQTNKVAGITLDVDAVSGATVPYVDMSLGMGTEENKPVANVTQKAASTFCEWLSAVTGHFYRLPTEAEWEYAARAGTTTAYSFGAAVRDLDDYAWHYSNSDNTYHPVGQKKPNPWGLFDMHGNVAEWTIDGYDADTYAQRKAGAVAPMSRPSELYPRSVRGGSYNDEPEQLRSAARRGSQERWKMRDPQFPKSEWWNTDAPFVGFRVVRHIGDTTPEERLEYWIHKEP